MSEEMDLDGSNTKRACDSCRTRKIRCDRAVPCSNCKVGKLTCTTTAAAQKVVRQRVHISEEYEKKIDRIEDRLSSIESVLARLASKLGDLDLQNDSTERSSQSRPSRVGSGRTAASMVEATTPAPFEGETAINSQSGYARELLTKVVGNTPSIGQNVEIKAALNALEELVTRQGHVNVSTASTTHSLINRSLSDVDVGKLERPPWPVMKEMLEETLKHPTMAISIIFPFLKMRNLFEVFGDAFQNPEDCSAPRRILAYGVGFNLFTDLSVMSRWTGLDASLLRRYGTMCKHHMEVAISQLDIFVPPSYENVMALILGAACAIEMCKPSLAWVLTAMAAGMSQGMGYHRYQTFQNDEEDDRSCKIYLFWMIYIFDKQLSLRLGRASVIQDWDMSLPFLSPTSTLGSVVLAGGQTVSYWAKVARVQGQAYEKLFSPAAFLRSPEERTRTAIDLINAMNQAWYERGDSDIIDFTPVLTGEDASKRRKMAMTSPNDTVPPSMRKRFAQQSYGTSLPLNGYISDPVERVEDMFFHSDVVVHYSTCALIQRAVSSDNMTFSQECLEYSRAALVAHERCQSQLNTKENKELWSGYIHWSILQAPFTPFVVIFCNAIQKADTTDLGSLTRFVTSLESCRTVSEGADKLYKMCHLFLQVAKLYIQAKKNDSRTQPQTVSQPSPDNFCAAASGTDLDLSTMMQFDPYLSALGLVPNSAWPMAEYAPTVSTSMDSFANVQNAASGLEAETFGVGHLPSGGVQNPAQDWFSGSRYLLNLMEAGDDLQIASLDNFI